jgi:hypothetical protein
MKWIIPDLLCNCRDIGGILTTDGQHIKYGKIVRSASLSKFTQENVEKNNMAFLPSLIYGQKDKLISKKIYCGMALSITTAHCIKSMR